eukprot:3118975-Pleurochrysis_carterae.AAC.1
MAFPGIHSCVLGKGHAQTRPKRSRGRTHSERSRNRTAFSITRSFQRRAPICVARSLHLLVCVPKNGSHGDCHGLECRCLQTRLRNNQDNASGLQKHALARQSM